MQSEHLDVSMLRLVRNSEAPFGGGALLLAGDFLLEAI